MVLKPTDVCKATQPYDILIVDEAHRLDRYRNISYQGSFKSNSVLLGLDPETCSSLDWILQKSQFRILFYDESQSVRPSDTPANQFNEILRNKTYGTRLEDLNLTVQMRCAAGTDYIAFINQLLLGKAFR